MQLLGRDLKFPIRVFITDPGGLTEHLDALVRGMSTEQLADWQSQRDVACRAPRHMLSPGGSAPLRDPDVVMIRSIELSVVR